MFQLFVWYAGIECWKIPRWLVTDVAWNCYDTNAGHLFNIIGWKNLKCQEQLQRATMVYRSLHGLAPNYLSSRFEKRETIYCLRDSDNKLKVPLPRTNYYQRTFTFCGATLCNSLPCQARQAESLGKFKYIIKQFFLRHDIRGKQLYHFYILEFLSL